MPLPTSAERRQLRSRAGDGAIGALALEGEVAGMTEMVEAMYR
jgi:hypothetical protein